MTKSPLHSIPEEPDGENGPESVLPDESAINPFAPETHAVAGPGADLKHEITAVKIHRPKKDEFFRIWSEVHDYQLLVVDDGMEKETYLVLPEFRHLVEGDVHPHRMYVGMNLHNTAFVWPVRLMDGSNDGGKSWADSAHDCAERAKSLWVKIKGNRSSGMYERTVATGNWGEPNWGSKTFTELIELAYAGRVVDRPDHPVLQKRSGDKK